MMEKLLKQQNRKLSPYLPTVGLDLLGSDTDPASLLGSLEPLLAGLEESMNLVLFGDPSLLTLLRSLPFSYVLAKETISMEDEPLSSVRRKRDSSLHLGLRAVKEGKLDAFVSLANTGALVAAALAHLKPFPPLRRPALMTLLPTKKKELAVLDVGATLLCKTQQLIEFAAMGIAYQKARGIPQPIVGLLNVGKEPFKGSLTLQEARSRLSSLEALHSYPFFYGNIEANEVFEGNVDVLVTEGLTGNVFLKTLEGAADFFLQKQQKTIPSPEWEAEEYPGAILCGIQGLVLKCHGSASKKTLYHTLIHAAKLVQGSFLEKMQSEIQAFFQIPRGFD